MNQFDEKAAQWDENPQRVKLGQAVAQALQQHLPLTERTVAMEFGCGTGLVTVPLAGHVASITAVDTSAGMLGVLSQKIEALHLSTIELLQIDLTREQLLNRTFDVIFCSMVLHHIKEHAPLLRDFYTLLNSGGTLAIVDLDDEDGTFHTDLAAADYTSFGRDTIKTAMDGCPLTNIKDTTLFTMPRERNGRMREYPIFLLTAQKP